MDREEEADEDEVGHRDRIPSEIGRCSSFFYKGYAKHCHGHKLFIIVVVVVRCVFLVFLGQ